MTSWQRSPPTTSKKWGKRDESQAKSGGNAMSRFGMIGIGTYIPGHSFLHRLDPRTKLAFTLLMVLTIFWSSTWWAYLLITALVFTVVMISQLPILFILRSLKPIWFILV